MRIADLAGGLSKQSLGCGIWRSPRSPRRVVRATRLTALARPYEVPVPLVQTRAFRPAGRRPRKWVALPRRALSRYLGFRTGRPNPARNPKCGDLRIERLARTTPLARIRLEKSTVLRWASAIAGSLVGPNFEVGSKPELYAALAKVNGRLGHLGVSTLVDADSVRMREAEQFGDAVSIQKVIDFDSPRHFVKSTGLVGSVRAYI
jgi:hypothetical protein